MQATTDKQALDRLTIAVTLLTWVAIIAVFAPSPMAQAAQEQSVTQEG